MEPDGWLHGFDVSFAIIDRDRRIRPSAQVLAHEALGRSTCARRPDRPGPCRHLWSRAHFLPSAAAVPCRAGFGCHVPSRSSPATPGNLKFNCDFVDIGSRDGTPSLRSAAERSRPGTAPTGARRPRRVDDIGSPEPRHPRHPCHTAHPSCRDLLDVARRLGRLRGRADRQRLCIGRAWCGGRDDWPPSSSGSACCPGRSATSSDRPDRSAGATPRAVVSRRLLHRLLPARLRGGHPLHAGTVQADHGDQLAGRRHRRIGRAAGVRRGCCSTDGLQGGGTARPATLTNLAYPIGDALLLGLIVGGFAVLSGRSGAVDPPGASAWL